MIPNQTFSCPHCGAPGQTINGQAEYSCQCRIGRMFAPQSPQIPSIPAPYNPPHWPWYTITSGTGGTTTITS